MRASFGLNFFFLMFILQIKSLHGQDATTVTPATSAGSNPHTSTLSNTTNGSASTTTYESRYTATSRNVTVTAAVQSTVVYSSTKNTSATDSFGTSVSSNGNSTQNYTVLATDTPVSHFSSSPTAVTTLTNTNATTTNLTNNGSHVSTMFTTDVPSTTNNTNNSATTIQLNATTNTSSDNTTTPSVLDTTINTTTLSASTHFNISEYSTLLTTMKKDSVTTDQSTDGSLMTENSTIIEYPRTSPKSPAQPTTNSSVLPFTEGTPKEAKTNGGVVFGAIIGSILGIVLILLVAYFICGVRKPDAFTHRRLYEDIKNEPVLRLDDSVEPYDVRYGASSYHNPTMVDETEYRPTGNKLDFIPMDNLPSNHPSA